MMPEDTGILTGDENVEAGEVTKAKAKRRPRPKSPKPRSVCPTPKSDDNTAKRTESLDGSLKRKSPRPKKDKVPSNPERGRTAKLPSNPTRGSPSPKGRSSPRNLSPRRGDPEESGEASKDKAPTSPKRRPGKASPSRTTDERGITPTKSREKSPKRSTPGEGRTGGRGRSPDNNSSQQRLHNSFNDSNTPRSISPKRRPKNDPPPTRQQHKSGSRKTTKPANNRNDAPRNNIDSLLEPSEQFMTANNKNDTGDGDTGSEVSSRGGTESPRYVSPKGNTTHLQLDLESIRPGGVVGGADSRDIPVFSLLDENSLVTGETDDDDDDNRANDDSPRPFTNTRQDDNQNKLKPPMKFKSWGFNDKGSDDDDDDDDDKVEGFAASSNNTPTSPNKGSSSLSPIAFKKAVKALKYSKPSISGASTMMGKMSSNFQQRLGLSPRHHQQMADDNGDDDGLEGLL